MRQTETKGGSNIASSSGTGGRQRQLDAMYRSDRWRSVTSSLGLSQRERQILEILLAGIDDEKRMAERLGISHHTIHTHIERLYRKLHVQSRSQLIAAVFVAYAISVDGECQP